MFKLGPMKLQLFASGISIYALRENVMTLHDELENVSAWLAENATNPKTPMEEIRAKQAKLAELTERHEIAAKELKRAEDGQRAKLAAQELKEPSDPKASDVKLRAAFIRAAVTGDKAQARSIAAKLGAIPAGDADLGGGENFLPKNMSNELIAEPMDDNPVRRISPVTNITGLVLPRIAYTIDDDDFINDDDVASEMALSGSQVTFGRHKSKVIAKISDTVLYGTDTDLVSYVQNALQSGLATKEKKCLFNADPAAAEAHMSFYAASNGIKRIEGATLYDAIVAALGDLNDAFAANATVLMTRAQYLAMVRELANDNATLWGSKPEDILGARVVFVDKAVTPIVGDFRYLRINYDITPKYDSDKDVTTGDSLFVLTAWLDIQFLLKSAFRLVSVASDPIITIVTQPYNKVVTEGAITGNVGVAAVASSGTLTYQWYKNTEAKTAGAEAISGATASSLTIPTDLTEGEYYFYCVVGISGTNVTKATDFAKVTVLGDET